MTEPRANRSLFHARRPQWLLVLAMLIGGAIPFAGLLLLTDSATWGAILAGLLFWPYAFLGGCVALIGEDKRG